MTRPRAGAMTCRRNPDIPPGFTALMCACQNQHFEIIKILLEYGANPNIIGSGVTAIDLLVLQPPDTSVEECIRLLLQHGANPRLTCLGKHNVHHHAVLKEWLGECVTAASVSLKRNHLQRGVIDRILHRAFNS